MKTILFAFALLVAGMGPQPAAGQPILAGYEDFYSSTVRQGMRACPPGLYMTGFHGGLNGVLCASMGVTYQTSEETADAFTSQFGMHVCPTGMAMTGLHVGRNILLCAPFRAGSHQRITDQSTQRGGANYGVHACPWAMPMVGILVGNNVFACEH